jgi:K+-transporting ATPase ATPase A chain
MTPIGCSQLLAFLVVLLLITKPLGAYIADVFRGNRTFLSPLLLPVERFIYRISGANPKNDQLWTTYAGACLAFSLTNFLLFYALLRWQGYLALNPQGFGTIHAPAGATPMTPDLTFNTVVSFLTNTSWQAYAGETALSYFSQMAGVCVQSFASAGVGIAVAIAVIRGFVRQSHGRLGNFWVDLTRSVLYVLLPLSLIGAIVLCSQGVIQNFRPYQSAATVENKTQMISQGPVASQESIKLLSSDGGGFFNANSGHPFENPTPLANFVEMLLILAIPAALTHTFGRMAGAPRQGWLLFAAMMFLFASGSILANWSEQQGNPRLHLDSGANMAGNMEGKEVRFGIPASALFSVVSTTSSDGAVNSAHDSFTPLAGLVQMFNMKSGEVIFGGTGSGLVSMLLLVLVTVFVAGLMVGRTPEYLGKKIESKEMKMVMLSSVGTAAAMLAFSAASLAVHFSTGSYWNPAGPLTSNLSNPGAHGLSEILYASASAVATNGSSFAGLNANTPWFNLTLGIQMLIGRFLVIIPALSIAGNLSRKRKLVETSGTMPTDNPLFLVLVLGTIFLITALTFLPAFSLGPIAEQYLMIAHP